MLKAISVLCVALLIIFVVKADTINREQVISYESMRVNHAWGCSQKYPQFCQKTRANPYTKPPPKNSEAS